MANIECKGKIKTQNLEIEGAFTALKNIGEGFSISDPVNVGIEIGRKDGISGTPYIDFHTDGNADTDFNSRIIATNNKLAITAIDGLMLNDQNVLAGSVDKSINGLLRLQNGLIFQWARFTNGYTGNFVLWFPVAFPNACLIATHAQFKNKNNDYDKTTITGVSREYISLNNSSYAMNYMVFAIGY